MAAGPLSIKLRCASWQQLATIYKRDLSRGTMFLKASTPPAIGTAVRIDLDAAERVGDRADRRRRAARHRSAARRGRRAQARADPAGSVWMIESALAAESKRRDTPATGVPIAVRPTGRRGPIADGIGDGDDMVAAEHELITRADRRGRVAAQAQPVPGARRRLRGQRRRRARRVRRADQALSPGSVRALRVDRAARSRGRDLHPDPRRVSQARRRGRSRAGARGARSLGGATRRPAARSVRAAGRDPPPPLAEACLRQSDRTRARAEPGAARRAARRAHGLGHDRAPSESPAIEAPHRARPTPPLARSGPIPTPPTATPAVLRRPPRASRSGRSPRTRASRSGRRRRRTRHRCRPIAGRCSRRRRRCRPRSPMTARSRTLLDAGQASTRRSPATSVLAKKHPQRSHVPRRHRARARGCARSSQRDRLEAAQRFEAALEIDPSNERAARELAEMRRQATNERKGLLSRLMGKKE